MTDDIDDRDSESLTESQNKQNSEAALQRNLQQILNILMPLTARSRARLLTTVAAFFGDPVSTATGRTSTRATTKSSSKFSTDRSMTPKEFLLEKLPQSDVERIVCLAYYLTHYKAAPYFGTIDLSKLNTEAAQRKFSNAAAAARNAVLLHYLASAPAKGKKQLSAAGEVFVQELPDRAAAKAAMAAVKPKKKYKSRKKSSKKKSQQR